MRRAATAYRPHGQPSPVRPAGGHLRPAAVLPGARLVLVTGALALLWTTVLWALK